MTSRARPPDISIRALRVFHGVVATGSVTAAGKALGLSQSAASRVLSALESRLGFELFHRDRGRLIATADALALFDEADRALTGVDRIRALVDDMASFRTGKLRLVAPPSFCEAVLPEIVAAFARDYPDIQLSIDSRSVETATALIASRAVDCGFVKLPVARDDLALEPMVDSIAACVLATGHPLAALASLDPRALRDVPLILLGAGRASRLQIEAAFAEEGVRPDVRIDVHTIGAACGLAASGMGVAIVNELLAERLLRPGVAVVPFAPRLPQRYAFATAQEVDNRLVSAFAECARRWFTQREAERSARHGPG